MFSKWSILGMCMFVAMIMTLPTALMADEWNKATQLTFNEPVVHFEERPSDSPEAIHSWFYPGDNYGQEFVYPRSRAIQLAKQVNRPVLSMPEPAPTEANQIKQVPVKAVTPSGEEIEVAEVVATQPITANSAPPTSLPKTGSYLPLLGLAGLLGLGSSVGLRMAARRIS
jgi:hypothetical protein